MTKRLFTPESISELKENEVFVFGSNLNGQHAGGAARIALEKFGAINGIAEGLQGQSYAIPTLSKDMERLGLDEISESIRRFIDFATGNQDKVFYVTKIGCGIAGFELNQIASLFKKENFPLNVTLPVEFTVTKGYKVFNHDWTCRDFQYEIGQDYKMDGEIECCGQGFHFCEKLVDCYDYYSYDKENKVAEIEVLGYTKTNDGKKHCTNHIKIVKEISWSEVDSLVNNGIGNSGRGNSGDRNSGDRNSGDRNSGDRNSGYRNSGDRNSGDLNSGDRNSGDLNSGDRNSGYLNSGDRNSGHRNSGDLNSGYRNSGDLNSGDLNSGDRNSGHRNSGDLNSGYRNSGVFCTRKREDTVPFFNKKSNMTWDEWYRHTAYDAACGLTITKWVSWNYMSDEEKRYNPKAFVPEGYVKVYTYKEAWANLWKTLSEKERNSFKTLPNYDADVFEEVTGIRFE